MSLTDHAPDTTPPPACSIGQALTTLNPADTAQLTTWLNATPPAGSHRGWTARRVADALNRCLAADYGSELRVPHTQVGKHRLGDCACPR